MSGLSRPKRSLANNKTTADALPAFVSDKAIALFEETGVLTKAEGPVPLAAARESGNSS